MSEIGRSHQQKPPNGSRKVKKLLVRLDQFDDNLKGMEVRSRQLRDLYTDMSEVHGGRLASLAKRHTRNLIPPQHTTKKNAKLHVEVTSQTPCVGTKR